MQKCEVYNFVVKVRILNCSGRSCAISGTRDRLGPLQLDPQATDTHSQQLASYIDLKSNTMAGEGVEWHTSMCQRAISGGVALHSVSQPSSNKPSVAELQ